MSFNPQPLWKNRRAVERARDVVLRHARERQRAAASTQVFSSAHSGQAHLQFFRAQFPQVIAHLPEQFTALELGSGMGWHAALLAAHAPAARVIATEVLWSGDNPYALPNVFTLYRLAEAEPRLNAVLSFDRDAGQHLRAVRFTERLRFARASAHDLPVCDGGLDLLWSHNCLEHIPDLRRCFAEAARALRPGGVMFHSTEPLFYSAFGHHLADIFPLCWGHLLWEPEELAAIAVREAGAGREWAPGVPLRPEHLLREVFPTLNGAPPRAIREALLAGPWQVLGWVDSVNPEHVALAKEAGLRDALPGIPAEALLLNGLTFRLRRVEHSRGLRTALRFPFTWRRWRR